MNAECPLLLVDLEKASSSDIDSVLRECNREREDPSIEISREGVRSVLKHQKGITVRKQRVKEMTAHQKRVVVTNGRLQIQRKKE